MINIKGLQVDGALRQFIDTEVLPGTGLDAPIFWRGVATIVSRYNDRNRNLLQVRDDLQNKIDDWHAQHPAHDPQAYKRFLSDIGYLVEAKSAAVIRPQNVDPEVATLAGAQLVVPVMNARFALNAANARWVSLYDALYGTDVIGDEDGAEQQAAYNPIRGKKVVDYGRNVLDSYLPLAGASHADVSEYKISNGKSVHRTSLIAVINNQEHALENPAQFVGFNQHKNELTQLLFRHNGLHIELVINRGGRIGGVDKAGIDDIVLEAALTTIQDCEDSVAAVDAQDKIDIYRNWLGLMQGTLETTFHKDGKAYTRRLNADRTYTACNTGTLTLAGRSLMFIRNVGHLMTNPAILDEQGREVFEGILDAIFTSLIAMHDLNKNDGLKNSRSGSVYIVKPKMHGPDEVQFTCDLFDDVELLLGLPANTIKLGIMDEERRTTVNLDACIDAAKERVVFINTGFLDRTGDEIHTSMLMGPMLRKAAIKEQPWISAYEQWNVDCGLEHGFSGHAQIGKGMWPMPDEMAQMMAAKKAHPNSGATTAWVPSPTAAALHALHYHEVNVAQVQIDIASRQKAALDDILKVPLQSETDMYSAEDIQAELDNNAQGILGYVVRWIDQGIGCSKVPDINNVGLMEDRATLRISSQHMCNWLHHGLCTEAQVRETFARMASVVDKQNEADENYIKMTDDLDNNPAFQAACELVFKGKEQPNGYTEPLLHAWRLKVKKGALNNKPQAKTY